MVDQVQKQRPEQVTIEDVNRLLEVGRLLFPVLSSNEIEQLQAILLLDRPQETLSIDQSDIGNTGVT